MNPVECAVVRENKPDEDSVNPDGYSFVDDVTSISYSGKGCNWTVEADLTPDGNDECWAVYVQNDDCDEMEFVMAFPTRDEAISFVKSEI